MAIPRIVYFAQTVTIKTSSATYKLPISSASIEVTRPIEAVSTFGKFSSLNTAQTNLTTCKATLKGYLGSATNLDSFSAAALNNMIDDTKSSTEMTITCASSAATDGFVMKGILTNIGIDISMGAFGMIDLGFAGIGNPTVYAPTTSATTAASTTYALNPITTMSVGTAGTTLASNYATSIKFSYDLPTDTLAALGDDPNAPQGNAKLVSQIATKAPYKTTVNVEGHGVDPTIKDAIFNGAGFTYKIGDISIVLPNPKASARSFNNAAGQVSASYAYTVEDTSATLSAATLSSYDPNLAAQLTPAYGA
jgi:hypothetical protein